MAKILMVCLGNICRSPLAHGILQSKLPDSFIVDSAGTGNYHIGSPPDSRSISVAKKHGINISTQKCRQFKVSDFDRFDIIYVMDSSNYNNVVNLARDSKDVSKVKLILEEIKTDISSEVPDPYYGDITDFEYVFNVLNEACEQIAINLKD